jgi:hypothetical protein
MGRDKDGRIMILTDTGLIKHVPEAEIQLENPPAERLKVSSAQDNCPEEDLPSIQTVHEDVQKAEPPRLLDRVRTSAKKRSTPLARNLGTARKQSRS